MSQNKKIFINNQPVGNLEYQLAGNEAEIFHIEIAKDYRRQGYGESLLRDFLAELAPQITAVFLEVRPSNHAALQLYLKLGFTQKYIRKNYYSNPLEDALILGINLG